MVRGIDEYGITVYENADGRLRAYDPKTGEITSYPRMLVERSIGRKLLKGEDVHHIDGNPLNNDLSNLQVLSHAEHARLHSKVLFDKPVLCANCHTVFNWTAHAQSQFLRNSRRNRYKNYTGEVFCSKRCSGQYSRREQLEREYFNFLEKVFIYGYE